MFTSFQTDWLRLFCVFAVYTWMCVEKLFQKTKKKATNRDK